MDLWRDRTLDRIHDAHYVTCREKAEREASPTAAIIDSQSVKSAEKGGARSTRMAKEAACSSQDRDGGVVVMATLFGLSPSCSSSMPMVAIRAGVSAGGEEGDRPLNVEIVKRSDQAKGFVVPPKRWIVERPFVWLGRCSRLAKDWECLNARALAFLKLASIRLMLRRLCNPS